MTFLYPTASTLNCAGKILDLRKPLIMGILNITPDSYYAHSRCLSVDIARQQALQMVNEGASIIDIGGESTRPGAQPVSLQEELERVIPVIESLHQEIPIPISIDTYKPQVMCEAIAAGAGFINDITALNDAQSLAIAKESQVPVCLMHMAGTPQTMQINPQYDDVIQNIKRFFRERIQTCTAAGIAPQNIILDPGFGFGKTLAHNIKLLNNLQAFTELGFPILVGLSRKSMLKDALGLPVEERLFGSIALATLALCNGARIIRTHDVKPTVQALQMAAIVLSEKNYESF